MRILLACQQSAGAYPVPAYDFWPTYFREGLKEAGHEVVEAPGADWAYGLLSLTPSARNRWLDEVWSRTLATAHAQDRIDLFLGYLYPRQIEPSAVRQIVARGIPAVNFFCDNVREFRRLPAEFAPFSLHWVPERAALAQYQARGWPALAAPMPCWVPAARRVLPARERSGVAFVGRRDPLRAGLLAEVARADLPLAVYGDTWHPSAPATRPPAPPDWRTRWSDWNDFLHRQGLRRTVRRLRGRTHSAAEPACDFSSCRHPTLTADEYFDVLSESSVTLGINRFPTPYADHAWELYSRLRDLEAPMLGACHLTEWTPELPHLFELGREIETYRTADELIATARALLQDPARRLGLRRAGQRRVLADHTVGRTLARIGATLGIAPPLSA